MFRHPDFVRPSGSLGPHSRGCETGEQPSWVIIVVAGTGPGVADDEQGLISTELARPVGRGAWRWGE